jgi:hypothetical protein
LARRSGDKLKLELQQNLNMDFATVVTTANLTDAELVCSRLEAAGFHPFVANENTASWLAGYSVLANVLVQVPETEAADAREFLKAP